MEIQVVWAKSEVFASAVTVNTDTPGSVPAAVEIPAVFAKHEIFLSNVTVTASVNVSINPLPINIQALVEKVTTRVKRIESALHRRNLEDVFIILVTIMHNDLEVPIRVSSDNGDVLSSGQRGTYSNGNEFVYLPFEIILPNLEGDSLPSAKISIDNIDRAITAAIKDIRTAPEVRIQIALSSDPDIIDYDIQGFKINSITYDSLTIEGNLSIEYFASEPFPAPRFTPSRFPGMFRGSSSQIGVS